MEEICYSTSGENIPYWLVSDERPKFSPLGENSRADVCIVGAGIAGLTTAYLMVKSGLSVIVLDDGEIASGESGRTTAHLQNAFDDRYYNVRDTFGLETARLIAESHTAAIDLIESIVTAENIDCEFRRLDGYLFLHEEGDPKELENELQAARQSGLKDVRMVKSLPVQTFDSGPALLFPNQGQFHPVKYLSALAKIIVKLGGQIFTRTRVSKFEGGHNAHVKTASGFTVSAKHIVVATNVPVNDRFVMYTKLEPMRSYVIYARVAKGSLPYCLMWDTADPYHYVRLTPENDQYDLLIVRGEDHKVGHESDYEKHFLLLKEWARRRYPIEEVVGKWSGQVIEPVDLLAYIGRNPSDDPNVYIVTGDSGTGMTHGTIAGILLTDMVLGRKNKWEEIYDPGRTTLKAAKAFARHNIQVGLKYKEYLTGGDVSDIEDIAPCSGAIIREGLSKYAVYKDADGKVHKCSAICPHLKAIVHWNSTEKSWDCPAHGSRFDKYGKVINGPSREDLEPIDKTSQA